MAAVSSKLQEIAAELAHFKESGKTVIAVGDGFSRDQYYLAAHADHVYMHPMGMVLVDGYSRYLPYYKSALDKLYIDYNVWTVGEYKSFVEPITRDGMSPRDEEASRAYLGALWSAYQADVTTARKLPGPALQSYADDIVKLLTNAGGDTGKLAVDYGLVDELLTRDAMRERIRMAVGEEATPEKGGDDYTAIGLDDYVRSLDLARKPARSADKVAVIVASGTILDGRQPSGSIGGDSLAELIRKVRLDDIGQGARAARRFGRGQRVRVRRDPARAPAVQGFRTTSRRIDEQRRCVRRLLDLDGGERDLGEPHDADGLDRRRRDDRDVPAHARHARSARRRHRHDADLGRLRPRDR